MGSETYHTNPADTVYKWSAMPPGLTKGIAYYAYHAAYLSVHEVAITASLSLMAATFGRSYVTPTNAGLNLYISLIADTGTGKEGVQDGVFTFVKEALKICPLLEMKMLAPRFASAQGIISYLHEMNCPCCINFIDEYGLYLQRMNTPNLKDTIARELSSIWLTAYSASKPDGFLQGISYSDTKKNVPNVDRPALSVCGWSTPDNFYKGVDEENISDGMLPRNVFIHYFGDRPASNQNRMPVPPDLLEFYRQAAKFAKELERDNKVLAVAYDNAHVKGLVDAIEEKCRSQINNGKNNVTKLLYNRAHLNILKIASLLAIGHNFTNPRMLPDHVAYAEGLVMRGIQDVIARFESGKVGQYVGSDPVTDQQQCLLKHIDKYRASDWSDQFGKSNRVTLEQFKQHIVNYQYFNANVRTKKQFRKTHDSERALKDTLQWAVDVGILRKLASEGKVYQIMPDGWSHATPAAKPPSEEFKAAFQKSMTLNFS